jgi:hypothetical protein
VDRRRRRVADDAHAQAAALGSDERVADTRAVEVVQGDVDIRCGMGCKGGEQRVGWPGVVVALFSLVTLFAHQLLQRQELPVRQAVWYQKSVPTFSDTLAFVRQQLWPVEISWLSGAKPDVVIIPKALFDRLTDTLAFAA